MNLTSIDFVVSRMASNGAKFWKMRDQAGTMLDLYETAEGTTEESISKLLDSHRQLSGSYVTITIYQRLIDGQRGGDTTKGIFKYNVLCSQSQQPTQQQHQAQPVAQPLSSSYLELLEKIKALEISLKEQEYKAQIKELEKRDTRGSNIDKLIETFTTIVMQQQQTKPAQPIAGPGDTSQDEFIKAVGQLVRLVGSKENFIKLTASLVNLQKTSPTQFNIYIKALMG